jgi:hypothetical membrane protein
MDATRLSGYVAVSLPLVFALGMAVVLAHNPWFSIQNNALSDMGSLKNPTRWYFNGFLMLFSLLAFLPAYTAFKSGLSYLMPVALLFLFLVGVFPEELPLHAPSAVIFYVLSFSDVAIIGVKLGRGGLGIGYLWSALSVLTFASVLLLIRLGTFRGLAVPELVGAFFLLSWFVFLGGCLLTGV